MTGIPRDARRLSPGFYEHAGELHVDLDEFILAAGGNPDSPEDRQTAERAIQRIAEEQNLPVETREE